MLLFLRFCFFLRFLNFYVYFLCLDFWSFQSLFLQISSLPFSLLSFYNSCTGHVIVSHESYGCSSLFLFFLFLLLTWWFQWLFFKFTNSFFWLVSLMLKFSGEYFTPIVFFSCYKISIWFFLIVSISLLIFVFCLYIIFLIFFHCVSIFPFSSLNIILTIILNSFSGSSKICIILDLVYRVLFCSINGARVSCLFVFLLIFCWDFGIRKKKKKDLICLIFA